ADRVEHVEGGAVEGVDGLAVDVVLDPGRQVRGDVPGRVLAGGAHAGASFGCAHSSGSVTVWSGWVVLRNACRVPARWRRICCSISVTGAPRSIRSTIASCSVTDSRARSGTNAKIESRMLPSRAHSASTSST